MKPPSGVDYNQTAGSHYKFIIPKLFYRHSFKKINFTAIAKSICHGYLCKEPQKPHMNINKIFFIADDDPDDQEILTAALKSIDKFCKCVTAFNGEQALQVLLKGMLTLPDIIFLDLNMPRMNGKQCLTEIKKNDLLQNIPVIIYSTSAEKKDIEETLNSGAAFFLQKPNRFDDLSQALNQIISRKWK